MSNEIQHIIEQLDQFAGFPEEALRAARQHKAKIIPALIELLERAAERAQNGERVDERSPLFALFLLGEFRAREALPAILRAVSLPGEKPFELFGDAIHDGLPETLAGIAGPDSPDAVRALLYDKQVNEYVRWAAARSLVKMVQGKLQERGQVITWLRQALRTAIEQADCQMCHAVIDTLLDLHPDEVYDEIHEAYARKLVDTSLFGDFAYIKKKIERGQTAEFPAGDPFITDCIEELKGWAAFDEVDTESSDLDEEAEEDLGRSSAVFPTLASGAFAHERRPQQQPVQPLLQPVRHDRPRVGRNDPCPCGSGKKFKRCCGAH